jgi:hypothetical protein
MQREFELELECPVMLDHEGSPKEFTKVVLRAPKNKYMKKASRIKSVIAFSKQVFAKEMMAIAGMHDSAKRIAAAEEDEEEEDKPMTGEELRDNIDMCIGDRDDLFNVIEDNFMTIACGGGCCFEDIDLTSSIWEDIDYLDGQKIMWEYIAHFLQSSPPQKKKSKKSSLKSRK